ncbi:hypothetical protein B0O99DRAFT_34660 [Bisporella sp. PMI_857]|nr:hypothetical protein B0O99DRAFT_34660 [Bisporella sp. PMI_857]
MGSSGECRTHTSLPVTFLKSISTCPQLAPYKRHKKTNIDSEPNLIAKPLLETMEFLNHNPSLSTTLGLRTLPAGAPPVSSYAAGFLIANFVSAYLLLSSRTPKQYYGFDHNANPREDIAKYGEPLVAAGKLPRRTLERIKRLEAASANAIDHYPVFVAAVLLGAIAKVDAPKMNGLMALYTVARLGYAVAYVAIESDSTSRVRGYLFWTGNVACMGMLWLAGRKL